VGSSTIWIVPAQGGAPRQVTKVGSPAGGHVAPTWSPDDQKIIFLALNFSTQVLWSTSVDGSDLKQLTDKMLGKVAHPVFSADGRWIYFDSGPLVEALPISPQTGLPLGQPVKLADVGVSFVSSLSLSSDGKRLAYSVQTQSSNIWSVPVSPKTNDAGPPFPITNQTGTRNNMPSFSPDGRKLAFMEYIRGGGADIWVSDSDGKNPISVTSNPRNLLPNWFPDGDQIAFLSLRDGHRSVWALSIQSRRERQLLSLANDIDYMRLSADGKQMLLNYQDDRGVINSWVVPVGGAQPKQVTFDKELAGFGCWSPDGKFIAYQMKRGDDSLLMLMPAEGGEAVQLTSGHGRSWPYSFSPDGDKILFAGERNGVWNVYWVSRSTKEQKQVTNYTKMNAFVRYPSWSPLGTQMAYEYSETTGNIWLMDLK
jgi:Tol biopolymer transport system component